MIVVGRWVLSPSAPLSVVNPLGGLMVKRILYSILTFFLVTVLIFGLFLLMPQDPVKMKVGDEADPVFEAALRYKYGFTYSPEIGAEEIPPTARYFRWLSGLLRLDLGISIRYDKSVNDLLGTRLPNTVGLAIISFIIDVVIGVSLGVFVAKVTNSGHYTFGAIINILTQIGIAIPVFFASILLILLVCIKLRLLPVTGFKPLESGLAPFLKGMILPAISISVGGVSLIVRYVRNAMTEELASDYVRCARSKGVSETKILFKHVLRNALIPIVTILGMRLASIITGSIVIEQVYSVPGIGTLMISGINSGDSILVQGICVYISMVVIIMYLVLDLLYMVIDPRIRVRS